MNTLKQSIIAVMLLSVVTGISLAQPATTATTFRMYTDATHTVSITAGTTIAGTGTFTWTQPAVGIFKSDATGNMSISAINLGTGSTDITGILNVSNGGTGTNTFGAAGTVAYSTGTTGPLGFSPVGTANQILISGGAGAPTWTNTIPAGTSVPFNLITSGSNTQATMTVGTGASLAPINNGTITANQFVGSGSTTNAVDLGTAEVAGTLGVGNGGTGVVSVATGTILVGSGGTSALTPLAIGSSGQVLTSTGTTATWTTLPSQALAKGRVAGDGINYSYTITPGVTIPATSTIIATLESGTNMTVTVTARTSTTFTVQAPIKLQATDFINYLVF